MSSSHDYHHHLYPHFLLRKKSQIFRMYKRNVCNFSASFSLVLFFSLQVHQYRIAMTAKDCSVMVTLVPSGEEEDDDEE